MAKLNIYDSVTNSIIKAIEEGQTGDKFKLPWQGEFSVPENVQSQNLYHGINIIVLWLSSMKKDYKSPQWGTYKQWLDEGAQVKKGEKGSQIVFWKSYTSEPSPDNEEEETRMFARWSTVFNADQVEGYDAKAGIGNCEVSSIGLADKFIDALGADIRFGGNRAFYNKKEDFISLPCSGDFIATKSSTATENYYSTLFHEATHWSGAAHRLDRTKGKIFGDEAYAFEELIAELGSAMLCASIGISSDTRADHAQYIDNWLEVLKSDNRFIFKAASQAQKAVDYLQSFQNQD